MRLALAISPSSPRTHSYGWLLTSKAPMPFSEFSRPRRNRPACRRAPGTGPQGRRRARDRVRHAHVPELCFPRRQFRAGARLLDWLGAQATWPLGSTSGPTPLQDRQLAQLLFWAAGSVATYVFIPALVIKLVFRERIADYGLNFRGILGSSWVYLVMFLFMARAVGVRLAHRRPSRRSIPFIISAGEPFWPRLWIWEMAYVCQFFALEFFFRGFMVHGLRQRLGIYAIFVMTVPYCMIHFGKPMAETFGAIGAGIVLGLMSLKTRSIWLGACLHVAVAMSMDFLALVAEGDAGLTCFKRPATVFPNFRHQSGLPGDQDAIKITLVGIVSDFAIKKTRVEYGRIADGGGV